MHLSGADFGWRYLYLLNDGLELRRTISPLFQQLHGLVEILHVLCVHLEEGCEFLQDVSDARCGRPAGRERGKAGLVRPEVVAPALQSVAFSTKRECECSRMLWFRTLLHSFTFHSRRSSPFSHAFLQVRKQKLAVEGVDGGDVREDVLHHLHRERPFIRLLH